MSEPDFILRRCSFDISYNVNLVVGGEEKSEDHQSHRDESSGHHECLYNMFYQSIWQKWQYNTLTSWWQNMKSWGITMIFRIHPLSTNNIWSQVCGDPYNTWPNWWTDWATWAVCGWENRTLCKNCNTTYSGGPTVHTPSYKYIYITWTLA